MTDFTSQHARMELLVGGELEFVAWPSNAIRCHQWRRLVPEIFSVDQVEFCSVELFQT